MRKDIWISLFIFGVVLFSWPFMSIFKHGMSLYLFIAWLLFIGLIMVSSLFAEKDGGGG